MCTGVELALMAASVAGTGATMYANDQRAEAQSEAAEDAMFAEIRRQEALDQQKQQAFQQVTQQTAGLDTTTDAMAAATARREQALQQNRSPMLPDSSGQYTPAADSGMRVVQQAYQQARTENAAETDARGAALAQLSSLGDALQDLRYTRQPWLNRIDAANQLSRGSASLLPSEIRSGVRGASDGAVAGMVGEFGSAVSNAGLGYYAGTGTGGTSGMSESEALRRLF